MTALQVVGEIAIGLFAAVAAYRCFSEPLRGARDAASWGSVLAAAAAASFMTALGISVDWTSPVFQVGWVLQGIVLPGLLVALSVRKFLGSDTPHPRPLRPLLFAGTTVAIGIPLLDDGIRIERTFGQVIPRISTSTLEGLLVQGFAFAAWALLLATFVVALVQTRGVLEMRAARRRMRNLLVCLVGGTALFLLAVALDGRGADDAARGAMLAAHALVVVSFGISCLVGLRSQLAHRPTAP